MTRDQALARTQKLLALAAKGSGATEEESRTAAVQAARIMTEHGLLPGSAPGATAPGTSAVDALAVIALKLQVERMQRQLADSEAARLRAMRNENERRHEAVARVRKEERVNGRKETRRSVKKTTLQEREEFARLGGRARANTLTAGRRAEIAKEAARARWAKWREQHPSVVEA